MSTNPTIETSIEAAADAVGSVWPLHSFVSANQLAGFEDRPFHEAVADAGQDIGAAAYRRAAMSRQA